MKIVYLIFGGWVFLLGFTIWGFIISLFNKEAGASLKSMGSYMLNPTGSEVTLGQMGDTVFNIIFLIFGGWQFILHSFVFGIIFGLFAKDFGATVKGNAMAGLALCSTKVAAKEAAAA